MTHERKQTKFQEEIMTQIRATEVNKDWANLLRFIRQTEAVIMKYIDLPVPCQKELAKTLSKSEFRLNSNQMYFSTLLG